MEIKEIYKDIASATNKIVEKGIDKVKDLATALDKVAQKAQDKYQKLTETFADIVDKKYYDCLTFELTEDKTAYAVVKSNYHKVIDGKVIVPSIYNGLPVIEIGQRALSKNFRINEIILPDTIEKIGACAFSFLNNLKRLNIPKSVKEIGRGAFLGSEFTSFTVDEENECFRAVDGNLFTKDKTELIAYAIGKKDEFYYVPEEVIKVREFAFWRTTLKNVVLNDNLIEIDDYAFSESSLQQINLPPFLEVIGAGAFSSCNKMRTLPIVIPATVNHIYHEAFYTTVDFNISFENPADYMVEEFYTIKKPKIKKVKKSVLKNPKKATALLTGKYCTYNWTAIRKSDKKVKE